MADLSTAFTAVLRAFQRVYLVIDALDESSDRRNLLDYLVNMVDSFDNVQLLVTGRKEADIERAISDISTNISLSNAYVDEDIRAYIKSRLRDDRKYKHRPEDLREEIEVALVKGAQGM